MPQHAYSSPAELIGELSVTNNLANGVLSQKNTAVSKAGPIRQVW